MARAGLTNALSRLAKAEAEFLQREFLSPVVAGGTVRVRLAGVVCPLRIEPETFRGWGVFRPCSATKAELVRPATLTEQQAYLELFPRVLLVLCERQQIDAAETIWQAVAAHRGDGRFQIEGAVLVRLVEEAERFDVVRARFDGLTFWFETIDPARDPATAAYLRTSLRDLLPASDLKRRGLTPEERAAYESCHKPRATVRQAAVRDETETRLQSALAHGGAKLVDYVERQDGYRVTYRLGRRTLVTSVDKQDLTVQVAGICLSGQDRRFDLSSLVGVLREGGSRTVPIGQDNHGFDEETYWSMYSDRA